MDKDYKDKLPLLRQQIPVGLRHGLLLLEKTAGDVDRSVVLFQEETIYIISSKTGVDIALARKHLVQNRFDVSATLKSIDEERYSQTERILRRYKDKEEAIGEIAWSIETTHSLKRNFWLDFACLENLEPELFCLMVIHEWLSYDGWEDLSSALYFHLDTVTEQIEKRLDLSQLAQTLRRAREIHQQRAEQQRAFLERESYCSSTPEFSQQNDLYDLQRPVLIDKLYNLVKQHIEKFP
jgi:hypothetical protein